MTLVYKSKSPNKVINQASKLADVATLRRLLQRYIR